MEAEKIFSKINKKNYNKILENILEKKDFPETIKNLLLNMLYKIETNYDDYEKIKILVPSKNEFIEKILINIKNMNSINLGLKEQNEESLLKKISALNREFVIDDKYIFGTAVSYIMMIGGVINSEEIIRNFTGWAWNNKNNNIDCEYENIVYQSLILLVKNKFMDSWRTNTIDDYVEILINTLTKLYDKELGDKIYTELISVIVQITINNNQLIKDDFIKKYLILRKRVDKLSDRDTLVNEINIERKKLFNDLRELDIILNDSKLLNKEYEKVKETVLKREHFEQKLRVKRITIVEKMKKHNEILDPKKYMEIKSELEEELYPIQKLDVENVSDKEIEETLIKLQKLVLEAIIVDIKKIDNIKLIIKYIYMIRYYSQIPFRKKKIADCKEIDKQLNYVEKVMISALYQTKLITTFLKDSDINNRIIKCIFECGVIDIKKIEILIKKQEEDIVVEIFDANNKDSEYKIKIEKEKMSQIEFNKKKKLFIN